MSRWQDFAACAGQDPALWFPQQDRRGGRPAAERAAQRQALETCAGCPVRAECAEAGQHEDHGIWGGLTPADRARAAGKLPPIRRPGPPPGIAGPPGASRVTALGPPAPPSCPICGTNDDVTREHFGGGFRWYCTGACGATMFSGGDDEWRHHSRQREQLRNRMEAHH